MTTTLTDPRPRPRVYFDPTVDAWCYQLPGCRPVQATSWADAWGDVAAAVSDQLAAQAEARQEDFPSDPQAGTPLESSSAGNLPVSWWRRWWLS
jgi:hypothetical protein